MIDINLLPEKDVLSRKEEKVRGYFIWGTIGLTVVTGLLLGGGLVYGNSLASKKATLIARKESARQRVNSSKDLATVLLITKQKAGGVDYIDKNSFNFPLGFSYVLKLIPLGVDLTKVSLADTGVVSFSGKALNSDIVTNFVRALASEKEIGGIKLVHLALGDDGKYEFTLSGTYVRANNN